MDYTHFLRPFGLEEKEALLYSHALSVGVFSVSEIAAKTGLKRPTCYIILEELVKKGFVSNIPQSKKLLYTAESPEILLKHAEQNVALAKELLPSLLGLNSQSEGAPLIKFYSGRKGVQNIFEDSLKKGIKEYYCIGSAQHLVGMAGEAFMSDYVKRRVKAGIKVIGLRMKDKEVEDETYNPKKMLRETRFVPKGTVIPNTIFIYKNKVAVISTRDGFGFLIESKDFAQTMMVLFKSLWAISTKA